MNDNIKQEELRKQQIAKADNEVEAICSIVENGIKILSNLTAPTETARLEDHRCAEAASILTEWIAKLVNRT